MEKEKKEEKDSSLSFKHWLGRTIGIAIILMIIVYLIEKYLGIPIVTHSLIAIFLTLFIGLAHEACHYVTALRLGYKPKWYRTKIMMGFEITPHTNRKIWREHNKKISIAPYVVLIPVSLIILGVGYYYWHLGLMVAGIAGLLLHGLSIKKEGVIV